MKKIYLLLTAVVIFSSCQKEEISPTLTNEGVTAIGKTFLKEVYFSELPEEVLSELNYLGTLESTKNSSTFFASINKNVPVRKLVGEYGEVSYTFLLNKSSNQANSSEEYFDNLVIFENKKGKDSVNYIRYSPTKDWYENSKDLKDYSGKITFYNEMGSKINSIEMIFGEMINRGTTNKEACSLVFEGSTTICTQLIDDNGDPLGTMTCHTTYYYQYECTSSGGGGDGDYDNGGGDPSDPDGLPRTGGTPPIIPDPPQDLNPCEQMTALENNTGFTTMLNDLKSKTGLNYETGYLMSEDGDDYSYVEINGQPYDAYIDLPANMGQINGYMHTHYTGLFSTFSGEDIKGIYQLYQNGNVSNLSTFTGVVVTDDNTTYSLKVDSETDFLNFSANNFDNATDFQEFEILYDTWYNINMGAGYSQVASRERALLKVLENSGLKLFRGNSTFSDWSLLEIDSSNIVTTNNDCN